MQTAALDLVSCKYDVQRKHTAEPRIARVREALAAEQKRRQELSRQLRMEQDDVERLEGMSFAAFVATLRGVKDERLRAERDEYLAARLRHDESVASAAALEAQLAELQAELASLDGAEARYEAALAAREQQVLASGSAARHRLQALAQEMGTLRATARELDEGAAAAHASEAALGEVLAMLEKAVEWGQWDMWGAGGLITTAIKHDHIEKARKAAGRARQTLQRLSIELADVGMEGGGLEVEVGELLGAADYFMDVFWVDLAVQRRIEDARDNVKKAGRQVVALIGRLQAEAARTAERTAALEGERRTLLEIR
jgi:hypothetical protein